MNFLPEMFFTQEYESGECMSRLELFSYGELLSAKIRIALGEHSILVRFTYLLQETRHVVVVNHTCYFAVAKFQDGSSPQSKTVATRRNVTDRAGLNAFALPLGCSGVAPNDEGFHRQAKVRRPTVGSAQEFLDRFLPAMNLIACDIFIDAIVGKDCIDALRLV